MPVPVDPTTNTTISALKSRYDMRIKTPIHIPWTFTRERSSYFLVDLFWLGLMSLCSLIFSSRLLVKLRSRLDIVVGGAEETLDFSNLSPPEIVEWLQKHQDMVQHVIDRGNTQIHLLARLIDPLPAAMAKPAYATFLVAAAASVYILFRFWILHRHWRYNNYPIIGVYALIHIFSFHTAMNTSVAIHVAVFWFLPLLTSVNVVLHKALGERAWQPLVVGLELRPKQHDVVVEKGGQDERCQCGEIILTT